MVLNGIYDSFWFSNIHTFFFFNDFKNTQILFNSKEIIPAPTSQGWEGGTRCVWIYRLVMISSLTPNSNPLLRFIIFSHTNKLYVKNINDCQLEEMFAWGKCLGIYLRLKINKNHKYANRFQNRYFTCTSPNSITCT